MDASQGLKWQRPKPAEANSKTSFVENRKQYYRDWYEKQNRASMCWDEKLKRGRPWLCFGGEEDSCLCEPVITRSETRLIPFKRNLSCERGHLSIAIGNTTTGYFLCDLNLEMFKLLILYTQLILYAINAL